MAEENHKIDCDLDEDCSCGEGLPLEVMLDDLVVVPRKVQLPRRCPNLECQKLLTGKGVLKVFEYQDQSRSAHVNAVPKPEAVGPFREIEWDDDLPDSGESYLMCEYQCGFCGCTLAKSQEIRL